MSNDNVVMSKKISRAKVPKPHVALFYLSVFTISFDIFLVFNIAGFNFRLSQIMFIPLMLIGILHSLYFRKVIRPIGFYSLIVWTFTIILFIPNTTFLNRSIGYGLFAIYNVLLIFSTVQLFDTRRKIMNLVRIYIYSFAFVGSFGIIQFILSISGLGSPLVTQWWPNGVPRVNGFSYEPSYYATYLLIGWVFIFYLRIKKSEIIKLNRLKAILIVLTIALVLCSSRLGWLIMLLWLFIFPINMIRKISLKGIIDLKGLVISLLLLISGTFLLFIINDSSNQYSYLLNGLGIGDMSSHSSSQRLTSLQNTVEIIKQSPLIGYSLGGINPAIGSLYGVTVKSQSAAESFGSINFFLESFAASGIFGFIAFLIFVFTLILKPIILSRKMKDSQMKNVLIGLVLSFIFLLIILQAKGNILRMYTWLHIAILCVVYRVSSCRFDKSGLFKNYNDK